MFINRDEIAVAVHLIPNQVAFKQWLGRRVRAASSSHDYRTSVRSGVLTRRSLPCVRESSTSPQLVLVIQDLAGKQEQVFRPRDARATVRTPTFAPDGSRVAFSLSDLNGHQIASVDVHGGDLRLLTTSAGLNTAPAYSPDGRQIAFSSSRSGDFEICVMDADGSNIQRLTQSPGLDTRPAWSPDGQRIAFTSNREGRYQIYVMNADGTGVRRFDDSHERQDYATWHPDGDRLLAVCESGGRSDLFLLTGSI